MMHLRFSNGSTETLKWIGLVLMTGDHVNKYLFNDTMPFLFNAGRLCLPIFVIVLAYNLARPQATDDARLRAMKRLLVFGVLSSIPFIALDGLLAGWWPLNVLFTLLVITIIVTLIENGGIANIMIAAVVFLIGGSSVEFWWPAVALGVAAWSYFKRQSVLAVFIWFLSCAALWFINGNWWALAVLPLILLASRVDLPVPRLRWAFYIYYPLHLSVIWLIRIPMSKAGYLFFY